MKIQIPYLKLKPTGRDQIDKIVKAWNKASQDEREEFMTVVAARLIEIRRQFR